MTGQVHSLRVEGFRSILGLEIRFGNVNVISGANGAGKSNLFNAFRIIKSAVEGRLSQAIAEQGGMQSLMWAGPRRSGPVRLKLAVSVDPFDYEIELGLRPQSEFPLFPLFPLDPQIKKEVVKLGGRVMVDRKTSVANIRGLDGPPELLPDLVDSESIFSQVKGSPEYAYLGTLRDLVEKWTFYHEFRTDALSPLRRPILGSYAPRLSESGDNLAAIFHLIRNTELQEPFERIFSAAFPDSRLLGDGSHFTVCIEGLERPMSAAELSDGTLKFLCLIAACYGFRPAPLIAFNEPEASLNPAVLLPLADALADASINSQLWITTHSEVLTKALTDRLDCRPILLTKENGETMLAGRSMKRGMILED